MKHLISAADLSTDEAVSILDTAESMAETSGRSVKKLPILNGRQVAIMFFEDSTRTRLSFDAAAKRLSADVLSFVGKGSSVSKGESLKDTVQTLGAIGADAFIVRHSASGAPHLLAHSDWVDAPIINAGDGTHQHPTQALLDAYTIRRRLGGGRGEDLAGKTVTIVGDILHSRVARSNIDLLTTLGATVKLVAPPTLLPVGIGHWNAQVFYDLDDAIDSGTDAMMMLRIQKERMGDGGFFPSPAEYQRRYCLDASRFGRLDDHAIVMHPGPLNRGLEISADVADDPRSVILDQVQAGVHVRMAVLYLLLGGE